MFKTIFKEFIPIMIINIMIIAGILVVKGAPSQVLPGVDGSGGIVVFSPLPEAFWFFPALACVVYIVLTVIQFFHESLFVPKTVLIAVIANLHVAIMLVKAGSVSSHLVAMLPSAGLLAAYVIWHLVSMRRKKVSS